MFEFFKKKTVKPKFQEADLSLTAEEVAIIQADSVRIQQEIDKLEASSIKDSVVLAKKYEELGLLFAQLPAINQGIEALEKSLSYQKSIGDGYKKLMSLYNQERKKAAENGDDAGIDKWMTKMDEMRQIAKEVTISGS
ncbi:tetratricopeptide repeat protein [Carnobacterium gallinarum]|uniref:hypothetical protein n=1 Tax=Carnobacterium gallinarum TaxID=2749 RepID=UPI0005561F9A|nr:hypothetical protein [Carnobacterium gallinarum]